MASIIKQQGAWTLLTWRDSKCRLLVAWWHPKPRWPRCWGRPCTSRFTQRHSYQFEPPSYHDRSRSQYDGDTSWLMISYWCFFWWLIIVVSQCSLLQQTWAPHGLGLAGEQNISWTRHHWFMAGLITINHHELLVISIYHHQTTINQPLSTMNHQQATMKNHSWTQQNSV